MSFRIICMFGNLARLICPSVIGAAILAALVGCGAMQSSNRQPDADSAEIQSNANSAFDTVGGKATAQEREALFQLILKDDEYVKDAIKENGLKVEELAKDMSIETIDLNNDGQMEYNVVLTEEYHLCGTIGNCPRRVYRKKDGTYQLLLASFDRELLLEETSTNKFRDLRSESGGTASEGGFDIYKFDGNEYQKKECNTRVYGEKEKIVRRKC